MQPFSFDGTERMRDRRGDREQAAEQVDAERSRLLREHSRMRSCTVYSYFIQCTVQRELQNEPQRREPNGSRCDVMWCGVEYRAARARRQDGVPAGAGHPAASGDQLGATPLQLQ